MASFLSTLSGPASSLAMSRHFVSTRPPAPGAHCAVNWATRLCHASCGSRKRPRMRTTASSTAATVSPPTCTRGGRDTGSAPAQATITVQPVSSWIRCGYFELGPRSRRSMAWSIVGGMSMVRRTCARLLSPSTSPVRGGSWCAARALPSRGWQSKPPDSDACLRCLLPEVVGTSELTDRTPSSSSPSDPAASAKVRRFMHRRRRLPLAGCRS
mmetsp:Transcript_29620/g.83522  ORF Transcript_29620/g.83522 Transcript_29620/m.83522 type:complete len:213 (+) Transcript_29620:880-1518(+)